MNIFKKIIEFLKSGFALFGKSRIPIDYNNLHKFDDTEYFIKDTVFKNGRLITFTQCFILIIY